MDSIAQTSQPNIFDTIIIGAGPAGITAAIYTVRKNLKVCVISKNIGGQVALTSDIENYPGFTIVDGITLANKFREEIDRFKDEGLWLKEGLEVTHISKINKENFEVETNDGNVFKSKTVIIATGRVPKLLGIPGENEFFGKGVSTCSTCDAPLFKGKNVAVIGGGNSALDASFALLKIAPTIYIITINSDVMGDEVLIKNIKNASNVEIYNNTQTLEIMGDKFVTGVKIKDKKTNQEQILAVEGIFVEIGWTPSTKFDNLSHKNSQGEIMVDNLGATTIPGLFAAGDVNDAWGEQMIIAAGEGAKVGLAVAEYMSKTPHQSGTNPHQQGTM
jgi:NADH-dependent peroxiredoxin subunit F